MVGPIASRILTNEPYEAKLRLLPAIHSQFPRPLLAVRCRSRGPIKIKKPEIPAMLRTTSAFNVYRDRFLELTKGPSADGIDRAPPLICVKVIAPPTKIGWIKKDGGLELPKEAASALVRERRHEQEAGNALDPRGTGKDRRQEI